MAHPDETYFKQDNVKKQQLFKFEQIHYEVLDEKLEKSFVKPPPKPKKKRSDSYDGEGNDGEEEEEDPIDDEDDIDTSSSDSEDNIMNRVYKKPQSRKKGKRKLKK